MARLRSWNTTTTNSGLRLAPTVSSSTGALSIPSNWRRLRANWHTTRICVSSRRPRPRHAGSPRWNRLVGADQAVILACGAAAAWLSQDRRPSWARWACLFGLVSQPFFLASTWSAGQWGMFALAMLYTAAWAKGAWSYWLAPAMTSKEKTY